MSLRPYQRQFNADIRAAFARGKRRVLGVMPTGGGKTVCFAELAAGFDDTVLIVCHRRELIRQASDKLRAIGVMHGVIMPGVPRRPQHRVQVASVGVRKLPPAGLIVLDEAHHAVAGQWTKLLATQPDARVVGVTATPQRLDGRGLGDVFDSLVLGPSVADLVAGGYLVPSRVFAPSVGVDFRGLASRAGDFAADDAARLMDRAAITGDAVEHYTWHCPLEPAVTFCATVEHAQHVAETFRAAGFRAAAVHGKTPADERDAAILGLGTTVDVLCSCSLIGEGVDVPAIGCVILLDPSESLTRVMQEIGRGMRPSPGKTCLTVLDHAGNIVRHGLPDAPREWSLDGSKAKPKPSAIRQCPQCYAIHSPAPRCPECGHASTAGNTPGRQIRTRDGTLVELTAEDVRLQSASLKSLVAETATWQDMQRISDARGYAPGWTDRMMRFKRGRRVPNIAATEEFA